MAFSDAEAMRLQRLWDAQMQETMTVYSEGAGGSYDVLAQAAVPCRVLTNRYRLPTSPERGEQAGNDQVTWPASYTLPETAQVLLRGQRWNLVAGTVQQTRLGPSAILVKQQADIVRAL